MRWDEQNRLRDGEVAQCTEIISEGRRSVWADNYYESERSIIGTPYFLRGTVLYNVLRYAAGL